MLFPQICDKGVATTSSEHSNLNCSLQKPGVVHDQSIVIGVLSTFNEGQLFVGDDVPEHLVEVVEEPSAPDDHPSGALVVAVTRVFLVIPIHHHDS